MDTSRYTDLELKVIDELETSIDPILMNEQEHDYYFAGISWGECFDILSPYQKRIDYDFETMEINKNEHN